MVLWPVVLQRCEKRKPKGCVVGSRSMIKNTANTKVKVTLLCSTAQQAQHFRVTMAKSVYYRYSYSIARLILVYCKFESGRLGYECIVICNCRSSRPHPSLNIIITDQAQHCIVISSRRNFALTSRCSTVQERRRQSFPRSNTRTGRGITVEPSLR